MTLPIDLEAKIGQEIGISEWVEVTQEMIDRFAEATGDFQPVHNDPEAAAAGPLGGTIAHGFLTLSLLTQLITKSPADPAKDVRMVFNYGTDRVRFTAPLRAGTRVRARFVLAKLAEGKAGTFLQTVHSVVEAEGSDRPVLVADWLFQRCL